VLQDGFGDHLSAEEMTVEIESRERLLRLKAGDRLRGSSASSDIYQDVLQEGRIVQFEVLSRRPDAPPAYVSAAMSNRITEVVSRGTWTGMSRTHGKQLDPLRRRDRDSISDETLRLDEVVSSSQLLDEVALAYHHGEIAEAISALTFTQRVHVFSRFWMGMSNAEIAAAQGCSKQTVERQWRTEIRPHLVSQLGHLLNLC
jgi:DNA-directed RNA polymerase specialized sigma24 family protein